MGLKTYFFDTYAFIEIIKGSPNYKEFSEYASIVTTKLQLMELYYSVLCESGKEKADFYYTLFSQSSVPLQDETIKHAMHFRLQHRKRKLSYVDCLGYGMAINRNLKFVTGDKEFIDMDHVEFVN